MLTISDRGRNFIKNCEAPGGVPIMESYPCPAGYWTNGWGHTFGVKQGEVLSSVEEAEKNFDFDVTQVEMRLRAMFPETVFSQGEWDALVSLCFNLKGGVSMLPHAAPKLYKYLKTGVMTLAADEFLDMDHALVKGKVVELPGLKTRRIKERDMFLT